MSAFLSSTLARYGLIAVAVLALAGGLYACGRDDGADAARGRSIERTLEAVETRRDVEDSAARDPDPAGRLLEQWRRD